MKIKWIYLFLCMTTFSLWPSKRVRFEPFPVDQKEDSKRVLKTASKPLSSLNDSFCFRLGCMSLASACFAMVAHTYCNDAPILGSISNITTVGLAVSTIVAAGWEATSERTKKFLLGAGSQVAMPRVGTDYRCFHKAESVLNPAKLFYSKCLPT